MLVEVKVVGEVAADAGSGVVAVGELASSGVALALFGC